MKNGVLLIFFCFASLLVSAQDGHSDPGLSGLGDAADSDPGLFIIMMMLLLGFLTAVCVVLLLGGLLIGAIVIFAIAGTMTFSVIAALYNRSLVAGFKWFTLISFMLLGSGAALLSYFVYLVSFDQTVRYNSRWLIILAAGILGGLLGGKLFLALAKSSYYYLRRRLN